LNLQTKNFITIKKHKIMKKLSLIIAAVFIFGVGNVVKAQDDETDNHDVRITIPTVSILDIEGTVGETGGQTVLLQPSVSDLEAGSEVDFGSASDNSLKLNYTSIVAEGATNKIHAAINEDLSDDGFKLILSVSSDNVGGAGNLGTAVQNVELGTNPSDVVTGIESCYSGNGPSNGRTLTYTLESEDYAKIIGKTFPDITVTYTITAEN
jgi:hypothetical protein